MCKLKFSCVIPSIMAKAAPHIPLIPATINRRCKRVYSSKNGRDEGGIKRSRQIGHYSFTLKAVSAHFEWI